VARVAGEVRGKRGPRMPVEGRRDNVDGNGGCREERRRSAGSVGGLRGGAEGRGMGLRGADRRERWRCHQAGGGRVRGRGEGRAAGQAVETRPSPAAVVTGSASSPGGRSAGTTARESAIRGPVPMITRRAMCRFRRFSPRCAVPGAYFPARSVPRQESSASIEVCCAFQPRSRLIFSVEASQGYRMNLRCCRCPLPAPSAPPRQPPSSRLRAGTACPGWLQATWAAGACREHVR